MRGEGETHGFDECEYLSYFSRIGWRGNIVRRLDGFWISCFVFG